ncbi:MAG: YebC/PmpR family DNA-binding transcriptional regulator [Firmicutes bacterium]|nr:YebC/PmpR family DNA-binding transcriptional regulator [Bacillota bacterium]
MSGHSKWANIKRRKAVVDAERGRTFSRLTREIVSAVRGGGPNPEANIRLKAAIEKARAHNLPNETIERAIARGSRAAAGEGYEEVQYEGYGPGGVALLLVASTDNRNRTAADIRHLFAKHGGSLGESGCVAWMFDRRGRVRVDAEGLDSEEALLEAALEAGADDAGVDDEGAFVETAPERVEEVAAALRRRGLAVEGAGVEMVAASRVELEGPDRRRFAALVEALEGHDDVEAVYHNGDLGEEEGEG